jgi:hypothetical protein
MAVLGLKRVAPVEYRVAPRRALAKAQQLDPLLVSA